MSKFWFFLTIAFCIVLTSNAEDFSISAQAKKLLNKIKENQYPKIAVQKVKEALKKVQVKMMTPKGSLACYKSHTEKLFTTLAAQTGTKESGCSSLTILKPIRNISSKKQHVFHIKEENDKDKFKEGRKQLKEAANKMLSTLKKCYTPCPQERLVLVMASIQTFQNKIKDCGEEDYLKEIIPELKQLCGEEMRSTIKTTITSPDIDFDEHDKLL